MTQANKPEDPEIRGEPHVPQIRTISSIGSDPSDWIGPGLHTHVPTPDAEKAAGDQPAGFLGPTSYSAIFRENKIGNTPDDFTHQATEAIYQEYDIANKSSPSGLCNLQAQEHIDQGVRVLQRFPDKDLCGRLIQRYYEVCDADLLEPMVYHVHRTTWSVYGKFLGEPRKPKTEGLTTMSKALCKTAMTPMPLSSNNQEWMDSFSGNQLRWEILGNFFAMFGLSVMTMSDWDPLFSISNKREYGGAMRECAEACLALCNDVDSSNDFVVSLLSSVFALQSFYEGDASESILERQHSVIKTILSLLATNGDQVNNYGGDLEVWPGKRACAYQNCF